MRKLIKYYFSSRHQKRNEKWQRTRPICHLFFKKRVQLNFTDYRGFLRQVLVKFSFTGLLKMRERF